VTYARSHLPFPAIEAITQTWTMPQQLQNDYD
jgi:hypothetical protein